MHYSKESPWLDIVTLNIDALRLTAHSALFWYHNKFVTGEERDERWYREELSPIPVDAESWQGSRDFLDLMSKVCKEISFLAKGLLLVEVKPKYRRSNKRYLLRAVDGVDTDNLSRRQKIHLGFHFISLPNTNELHVFTWIFILFNFSMSDFLSWIFIKESPRVILQSF